MYRILLLLGVGILAGCSDNPTKKVDAYFADENYEDAAQWLEKQLEEAPGNPLINGLAAEAYTHLCLKTNCFETQNAPEIARINTLLSRVKTKRIPTGEEGISRNIHENIELALRKKTQEQDGAKHVVQFQKSFTDGATRILLAEQLNNIASHLFINLETQESGLALLQEIAAASEESFNGHLANLTTAIATKNAVQMNRGLTGVRTKGKNTQADPDLASTLPMAFFKLAIQEDATRGTNAYLEGLFAQIDGLKAEPLSKPSAQQAMARALIHMAEDPKFLSEALKHFQHDALPALKNTLTPAAAQPETNTSDIPVIEETPLAADSPAPVASSRLDNPQQIIAMFLFKQSIMLNPRNTTTWQKFTPLALEYAARTDSYKHLEGLASLDAPASSLTNYNNHMIALANQYRASGRDALEPLSYVILPQEGGDVFKKPRDKILIEMLDQALEEKNTDEMVRIASFDVSVAKESRQKIVNSLVVSMKDLWEQDNYDPILAYTDFLVKTMEIDFNLDGLLLQNFDLYLQSIDIVAMLKADTPEMLLEIQEDVAIDLGSKFKFLTQHFKTNPAVMDTQLKKIILKAEGTYGKPVAFYRLQHYINPAVFPPAEQETYFLNTLQNALLADKQLTGPAFADLGYQLALFHPALPLEFVATESLERTTTLADSRQIWKQAAPEMKDTLRVVNAQFYTFMVGVDSFEKEQYNQALEHLSALEDKKMLGMAGKYIDFYRGLILDSQGTYLTEQGDDKMKALVVNITPQVSKKRTEGEPLSREYLSGLNVTVINGIGSVQETSAQTLSVDHGIVHRATLKTHLNPDEQSITLTEEDLSQADFNHSFSKIFGPFQKISFPETALLSLMTGNSEKNYRFRRVDPNPYQPLFVFGRFGVTKQISAANPATDHILPPGSILEIETDIKSPLQPIRNGQKLGIVFPVFGSLQHPASGEDIKVGGFYNLNKHTLNLSYKYPYGQSQAPLEARLRCQMVESYLRCAGHNKHWEKNRYSHLVVGRKAIGGPVMPVIAEAEAKSTDATSATASSSSEETSETGLSTEGAEKVESLKPAIFPEAEEVDVLEFPDILDE